MRNEVLKATNTVIENGNDFLKRTKEFTECVKVLLDAASGLRDVLIKYDGGTCDE